MALGAKSMSALLVAASLAEGASAQTTAGGHKLIKGISWGPVPLLSVEGASQLPQDDWMSDQAVPMWGKAGRADLRVMKDLGANLVRLYGNNPENDHTNFLDEAHAEGLEVAPGLSDYPYFQQVPGRCLDTNFNCFEQIKPAYAMNLAKGFLTPDRHYHPALKVMNILNEPDLKMPPTTDIGGPEGPIQMGRTLISAFDAMLDAEKEAGVTGKLINFTATFSYAICAPCTRFKLSPALGQMWQLHDAMHHPDKYGYKPRNNITEAYVKRWTHSFNTQNPATDLKHQFLDDYEMTFPTTPVYIGEYHRVRANQTEDLSMILSLAEQSSLFFGISFFEYQVAYWKTGSEMDFGMFGLGDYIIEEMPYFGKSFNIHCLTTQVNSLTGKTISNELRSVYKGPGLDESVLCKPNPLAAPTSGYGYAQVMNQKDPHQMAVFAENVVQHLGGVVTNYEKLNGMAQATVGNPPKWADLVSDLAYGPDWVEIDPAAKCVADRNAMPSVVGEQISWVCSNANSFSCDELPKHCADNTYRTADYVFSRYYEELGNQASPLTSCNFTNSGIYASSRIYRRWTGAEFCIKDAATGPMPQPIPVPSPSPLPSPTPGPSPPADLPMPSPSPGDGDGHHDITLTETTTTAGAAASTTSEMEMASFTTSSAKVNSWLALALLAGCGLLWA